MKARNRNYLIHYLVLGAIIIFGIVLFYLFDGKENKQFLIIILAALSYFFWGMWHHKLKGDFHAKIMVEYLLIVFLVIVLARGILFG